MAIVAVRLADEPTVLTAASAKAKSLAALESGHDIEVGSTMPDLAPAVATKRNGRSGNGLTLNLGEDTDDSSFEAFSDPPR